jgi:hypothetical protein
MVLPNKARVYRRRPPTELERKSLNIDRLGLGQGGSRAKGSHAKSSRVGDDLVGAFEEMARHLRGEIELKAHDLPGGTMTPAQIKAIRRLPRRPRNSSDYLGFQRERWNPTSRAGEASMARCVHCYASSIANRMPLGARSRPRSDH